MKPYDDNIQTFAAMFTGYDQALSRLGDAVKVKEPTPAFVALFEALNWAVSLDERAGEHWAPEGEVLGFGWRERVRGAHLMQAVRFVRNSIHHQWSDALELDESGRAFPKTFPVVFFEWRWRALSDLPPGRVQKSEKIKPRQAAEEAAYQETLEGKPARTTLHDLGEAFYFLRQVLEPGSIPKRGRRPGTPPSHLAKFGHSRAQSAFSGGF
jgi:hypothetical protein